MLRLASDGLLQTAGGRKKKRCYSYQLLGRDTFRLKLSGGRVPQSKAAGDCAVYYTPLSPMKKNQKKNKKIFQKNFMPCI